MTFDFNKLITISGDKWKTSPFKFYGKDEILQLNFSKSGSSPSWQDIILSGNGSLTLTKAKENGLNYLKLFGDTEQTGTPSPDTPMDIVCNNGAIKVYKNLFDRNDPTTTINAYVGSSSVGSSATIVSSTNDRSFIIKTKPNTKYTIQKLGGESPYNRFRVSESSDFPQIGQTVIKLYEDSNATSGLRTTTVTTGNNGNYIIVYGLNGNPSAELPTFLNNFVVCEGETINAGQIYTDGTVETVEITGKNLFDQLTATRYRTSWTNSGDGFWQVTSETSQAVCYGCYVKPNTTYTLSKKGGSRLIITGYITKTEPSEEQLTPADYKIRTDTGEVVDGSYTFTTPADCTWILFGLRQNNSKPTFPYDVQLELGSTATTYEQYFNGGSATAEMLLKVGDYQDVQSVLDGDVTRNVGVKVLDGTESWQNISNYINISKEDLGSDSTVMPSNSTNIICSHFETKTGAFVDGIGIGGSYVNFKYDSLFTTVAQFKQFLASQYTAGTPVIVVYPLKTPTTETVTAQPLSIQAGTNTVEITQASFDNLGLEVSYKGKI